MQTTNIMVSRSAISRNSFENAPSLSPSLPLTPADTYLEEIGQKFFERMKRMTMRSCRKPKVVLCQRKKEVTLKTYDQFENVCRELGIRVM